MKIENLISNKVPILFVGPPGVGKTAIINQTFDYSEIVLTSTMVEEDISGIPYREDKFDLRTIPAIFRRLNEAAKKGKTTCLFLDELDKARRSVADTLLTLVASRRAGEASLPDTTCIIAAANPPEFGGGDGISDAMISRFSVINFVPSVTDWCNWAKESFSNSKCINVINSISSGEIPIFDMVGEGLEKRISSPRTIALALEFLEMKPSKEDFETISRGLLTANVASKIIHYAFSLNDKTLKKSVNIKIKAEKQFKPLVL